MEKICGIYKQIVQFHHNLYTHHLLLQGDQKKEVEKHTQKDHPCMETDSTVHIYDLLRLIFSPLQQPLSPQ
jgi:hypothetical protein